MSIAELFLLAVGLSMDAFAVSICKGLSLRNIKVKHIGRVTITGDYIKGKGSPIIELRGTPALEEASATHIDKQD